MTTPEITELDAQTVERIAAGEVVERPASAVKELVENSIDADADRVTVAVEAGGKESIRVSDDGIGMTESALERAVEKHTTSKISDISDLESGVGTLGFRGEALHAISAVSRMTITTRPRDGGRGTELTIEGGEITDISPAGCPTGTTVEIRDLFYNVPARRKYLKQDATEFAHVNTVVTNYALANPDVSVTLEHNDRETFATTGTDNLQETVMSVYGREVAEAMIELDEDDLPEGPLDGISGLVSHPETNRASREYLSTFVNGRYVTANSVREAVVEAYGGQLAADRYPFAVVFLTVDPGTVDVNVHPRKREVRFADETGIQNQVETVIEEALLREGLIRSSAPRGRSAAEQTEIRPENIRTDRNVRTDSNGTDQTGEPAETEPNEQTGESTDTVERTSASETTAKASSAGTPASADSKEYEDDPEVTDPASVTGAASDSANTTKPSDPTASADSTPAMPTGEKQTTEGTTGTTQPKSQTETNAASHESPSRDRKFQRNGKQAKLDGEEQTNQESFDSLPSMRILGQLHETYIVAETESGLVLIDQHAADERINYERLRESFTTETTTQALAQPVHLELTARETELFSTHEDALASLGFHASLVDDRTVEVTTVPSLVAETAEPALLRDVLDEFVSKGTAGETVEAAADELLADLACYPSVTGNTSLTDGSVVELLAELDACENPYACPHGRPVIIELDSGEIDDRFERDYPGH